MKIYIIGCDQMWATGVDEVHYRKVLRELGHQIVGNPIAAEAIVAVTWYHMIKWYWFLLKRAFPNKRFYAVLSSNPAFHPEYFEPIRKIADEYIYFNTQQFEFLKAEGIEESAMHYNPVYVDETIYSPVRLSKKDLAARLGLDYSRLKGRYVIGSLQRDSLGDELDKPKWQKDPDLLLSVLQRLDQDKFVLLLGGPRRHYIIKQCQRLSIPYYYIGDESYVISGRDDYHDGKNFLSKSETNLFYNLCDLYIVSSKSEGAPMAAVETALCKVPVIATRVGMAADFLAPSMIYSSPQEAAELVTRCMEDPQFTEEVVGTTFQQTIRVNNYGALLERMGQIFQ
ncbi:glycosyltransferase [Desulfogranum mediterraneum]|uniref:glycosyltransferase n=1 Tax=Desulfogranum mediterraneum TaxID=160661 RepID=UPI00041273D2|nr:glycosyltransferase [Desulfogranum mediterraneum]